MSHAPRCRHGVPLRTLRVGFNDACERCRMEARAYDRATRRIGDELTRRYKTGEFDHVREDHVRDHTSDPGYSRFWDDVRREAAEVWSDVWKERRAMGVERRRMEVEELLTRPVFLPDWLEELLTECREDFTPRQVEALVYRHGYGLSLQEAGDALGIKRQTFRKRLAQANAKVSHLRGDVLRDIAPMDPAVISQFLLPGEELVEGQIVRTGVHTTSNGVNREQKDSAASRDVSPDGEDHRT